LKQIGWALSRFQGKYNEFTLGLIHGLFLLLLKAIEGNLEPVHSTKELGLRGE